MQKYTFTELLDTPEARELIEGIEELIGETEGRLVRIRESYISQLAEKYGYQYSI
jgi:hypothetical protein